MSSYELPNTSVLRGVAFTSSRKSYLFIDIGPNNANAIGTHLRSEGGFVIFAVSYNSAVEMEKEFLSETRLEMIKGSENVILNSSVHYYEIMDQSKKFKSECHVPITESGRIWIGESIILIWSCVGETEQIHDEAVLIIGINPPEGLLENETYRRTMVGVKKFSGKYLTDALMKNIDWTTDNYTNFAMVTPIPLPCSFNQFKFLYIIVCLIFIWVLVLATVFWVNFDDCCAKTSNQVVPLRI